MLLPRAFELIELLAFAGTYTDQPTDQPGSQVIEQILTPLRVPIDKGPKPDVFVTQVEIGPPVIGELMAGLHDARTGGTIWAPLKVLKDANAARFERRQDRRFLIECPGLRFLIFTPLVAFPLAVFPFFRDPLDPLAHFQQYVADYFPAVRRVLGGSSEQGRWLELSEGAVRLRIWTHRGQMYVDIADRAKGTTGLAVKFKNTAFFGVRASPGAATIPTTVEDMSKISCRNTGAIKRTWTLPDGKRARAVASARPLIDQSALLDLGCRLPDDLGRIGAALGAVEQT